MKFENGSSEQAMARKERKPPALILAEQDGADFYYIDLVGGEKIWRAPFHVADGDLAAAHQARQAFQGFCASLFGTYADFGDSGISHLAE